MAADAAVVGALGLLHATAAGAVVLGGLALAIPGLIEVEGSAEAAAQSVAFGLGCLRVPLEAGDVQGTFAPLSGLGLTLWGISSATRKAAPRWAGPRPVHVGAVALAFGAVCTAAAAAAGRAGGVDPSLPGAGLAGVAWGAVAASWGTRPGLARPELARPELARPELARPELARPELARPELARPELARPGAQPPRLAAPAWARPGLVAALTAGAVAAVWFLAALAVTVAGRPAREVVGLTLLGVAAAPNALAALTAIGLGASVDATVGIALSSGAAEPLVATSSLWEWGRGGGAPVYALALVLGPLAGALAGGRAAQASDPTAATHRRGLRTGAVFGAVLVAVGWAGSLSATSTAAGDRFQVGFAFPGPAVFLLALAWGVAGAYAARLPWPPRRSRVRPP